MRASKLKLVRVEQGLKAKDVAKNIGISPAYLSMIENKQKSLTIQLLISLANLYGVKPTELTDQLT